MKLALLLLALQYAFAAPSSAPLAFSARIQDAALAEEAIDLLHCVAERKGIAWELAGENAGAPSVRLEEKDGRLEGTYRDDSIKKFELVKNGWRAACDQLVPASQQEEKIASRAPLSLPTEDPVSESTASPTRKWIIAGAAVAVIAGGFILWRANRPDHRGLRME